MNQMVIAAISSSSGKTTVTMGILAAFRERGMSVQPFKIGPDYLDPFFQERAAGIVSHNLDLFMMGEYGVCDVYQKATEHKDAAVVEGVMGIYDGSGIRSMEGSTAAVAKLLSLPVILVLDAKAMSKTAAAVVLGIREYDREVDLRGIIVNRVSSARHYELIERSILEKTGIPCLGFLPEDPVMDFQSRHLGLKLDPLHEDGIDERITKIGQFVEKHLNLSHLLKLTSIKGVPTGNRISEEKRPKPERIRRLGIARDEAFSFYYEDNLHLLREAGIQLIPFSPMRDKRLPESLHGLYFGGGFPELYLKELSSNKTLLHEIREKIQRGMPAFGECGGYMYLTEGIRDPKGGFHPMVGVFQGFCEMTSSLNRFGYTTIFLGPYEMKGHEFHHSRWVGLEEKDRAFSCLKHYGMEEEAYRTGQHYENCYGSYIHIHLRSNRNFLPAAIRVLDQWRVRNEHENS